MILGLSTILLKSAAVLVGLTLLLHPSNKPMPPHISLMPQIDPHIGEDD